MNAGHVAQAMLKEAPEMRDVILFAYTVMSRIMTEHDGICILRNMFVTGSSFVYFATSRLTEKMRHSGMGCRIPDSVHGSSQRRCRLATGISYPQDERTSRQQLTRGLPIP